jgi:hypothetical protein
MAKNKNKGKQAASPSTSSGGAPEVKAEVPAEVEAVEQAASPPPVDVPEQSGSQPASSEAVEGGRDKLQQDLDAAIAEIAALKAQLVQRDAELLELKARPAAASSSAAAPAPVPSEDIQKLQVEQSVDPSLTAASSILCSLDLDVLEGAKGLVSLG